MLFFQRNETVVQVETRQFLTILFIRPDLLLQRIVTHKPTGMDVSHKQRNLRLSRIHPRSVSLEHTTAGYTYINKSVFVIPYDKGAPLHGKLKICCQETSTGSFRVIPGLQAGVFPLRPFNPAR
jgi:hypothetical protein